MTVDGKGSDLEMDVRADSDREIKGYAEKFGVSSGAIEGQTTEVRNHVALNGTLSKRNKSLV